MTNKSCLSEVIFVRVAQQLPGLLRKDLYSDNDQDHAGRICKGLANRGEGIGILDLSLMTGD